MKYLGHLLRSDPYDPERQVSIDADLNRICRTYARIGRPRGNWIVDNIENAYHEIFDDQLYGSDFQKLLLFCASVETLI